MTQKKALLDGKICNILRIINLSKISNWEDIKGKSLWVNINFNRTDQVNISEHIFSSFKITLLTDDNGEVIAFNAAEKKSILNFKTDVFLRWTIN